MKRTHPKMPEPLRLMLKSRYEVIGLQRLSEEILESSGEGIHPTTLRAYLRTPDCTIYRRMLNAIEKWSNADEVAETEPEKEPAPVSKLTEVTRIANVFDFDEDEFLERILTLGLDEFKKLLS